MSEQAEALKKLAVASGIVPEPPAEPDPAEGTGRVTSGAPQVVLPGDAVLLSQFAREMGRILGRNFLYRRESTVLMVNGVKRQLEPVDADAFRSLVEQRLVCVREVRHRESVFTVEQTMEVQVARGCLRAPEFLALLPEVERVNTVRLPVMRPARDGKPGVIELLPEGYDAESRTYTFPSGIVYDEGMSLDQGVDVLASLTSEFPFGDLPEVAAENTGAVKPSRSQAVVISGMLTMFCAELLPLRARKPAFVYTSNSVGSGKTLLAQLAVATVIGDATVTTWPSREEELKKLLDSCVLNKDVYILFDNLRGMIKSPALEGFLTGSSWGGRLLGGNTKFVAPNYTTVFLTGNQATVNEDMDRRCLYVELFVEEADVQQRKISREIDETWLAQEENRARILSAMWALVRAWDAAGRPPNPRRFASFTDWGRVVGGIVLHAGLGDCIERVELERGGATEPMDIRELMRALVKLQEQMTGTSRDFEFGVIVKAAVDGGLFEWILGDADPDDLAPKERSGFGKLLRRWQGRTFDYSDGLKVKFGLRGKHRGRRYVLQVLRRPSAAAVVDVAPGA